ncbi:MAG: CheR family methyltransferase [Prochloraceae cyanobacterium]|nr:CheR family methyltransferase [Prochloraceae cyanobacterium]
MKDPDCVNFLQQILPKLHLRWSGFQRVRRQVCRRLRNRFLKLGLEDFTSYRTYLLDHPDEWSNVDACCRITISRFYRDAVVFEQLCQVLPTLIQLGQERRDSSICCWCAGCASGEEVYTLKPIEHFRLSGLKLFLPLHILGTDIDEYLLSRARRGCYPKGTLKELPKPWIAKAFDGDRQYCLKSAFREGIEFEQQDIRKQMPDSLFHLILCRYLAFTYFEPMLQQKVLQGILDRLVPEGILVIGKKESLPINGKSQLIKLSSTGIYQKKSANYPPSNPR